MYWPNGADPWNLANPTDNNARKNYYNVTGTPTMKCDGSTCSVSQSAIVNAINGRLAVPSHIWLDLNMTVNSGTLNVTVTAVSDVNVSGNVVLQTVLMERYVYLVSPNNQNNHYHPMLDMQPTANGQTFSTTANDTAYFYASFVLDASWDPTNLDVGVFVQNNSTKEILQGSLEQVPVNFPGLSYVDYTLEDDGNNDGRAEAGETASMYVTMENGGPFQPAINVTGTITTDDPDLDITTPTVSFPDIMNGSQGTNEDPFVFYVSPDAEPHESSIHVTITADPLQTVTEFDIDLYIGWPEILLMDDDGTSAMETYYIEPLENLGKSYQYWETNTMGSPSASYIAGYPIIIWLTGWSSFNVLDATERTLIEGYLNNGGYLFMSGQNIAQDLSSSAPTWMSDVLHVTYGTPNTQYKYLDGTGTDPIFSVMSLDCNPGGTGSGTCTNPDGVNFVNPGEEIFIYSNQAYYGGIAYENENGGKLVFFSFPFEAISGQGGTNNRDEVMEGILDWFGPIMSVDPEAPTQVPVEYTFADAYPNPFNPTTTIQYGLPTSCNVTLSVYDLTGSKVATLVDGYRTAGAYEVTFDGTDLASGVYLYRLEAGKSIISGKMVLLK